MASVDTITFSNVPLDTLGVGALPLTTYAGALNVDYSTGLVTGNLQVAPALGIPLTNYNNFVLTPGAGGTYTITGTGQTAGLVNSTISIQYAGAAPTSVNTQYYAAGLELASGTGGGVTSAAVCFAGGTRIRTTRGDIAVDDLLVGDLAVVTSGAARPIRWIGHRKVRCRGHRDPRGVMPVRISAHAFAPGRPARDLYVSPGHALCVDIDSEALIPAHVLINRTTVEQVEVDEITYWHVELDTHDVLVADSMPAESYFDMGNRRFFAQAEVVSLHASPEVDMAQRTHADFCRPYHAGGDLVDRARAHLRDRAQALGWTLVGDLDVHLDVDGRRVEPIVHGRTIHFTLPPDAEEVWLVSATARPCDVLDTSDARDLGLSIACLRIDGRDVTIDDPLLCAGFHSVETGAFRWTAGRARLPSALWRDCRREVRLEIELAGWSLPRWRREGSRPSLARAG